MSNDLDELVEVLEAIRELVAEGRDLYDRDWRQRWALERGWIFAGNLAERISRRDGPNDVWAELIAIRNVYAHYTPGTIDASRVWFDAETDIERVLEQVRRAAT